MPTSLRKLAANRANAQKSTGPTSQAGKTKVAQNRTVHGLAGQFQVLECESQDEFDRFLNALIADEKPVGLAEIELVKKMAEHSWLAKRALRLQDKMFVMSERTPEHIANDTCEISLRRELDIYVRYHTAHDRAYQRASKELRERRNERLKAAIGFERKKQLEADEKRKTELHPHKLAAAASRAEREQSNAILRAIAAASKMERFIPPQNSKIAA